MSEERTPRPKSQHTPATVRAIADQMSRQAGDLNSLAMAMETLNFDSLNVGNDDQRRRGLQFLDNFVKAVKDAMLAAREERDFAVKPAPKTKPKK